MQVPILNGIYTDAGPEIRASYPVNLLPVPRQSGVSEGYLRPADGIVANGTGPGVSRGGINWNGVCYRVMGTKFVSVDADGVVSVLGDVGGVSTPVTMDYSFDRLAISSGGNLFYWNGVALTQVTDSDLGTVLDFAWVDGYFMTTDGTNLVVTELSDPTQVNPLKYGSSEADPDPVIAIVKVRNEIYALNRYTIEVFDNVGGDFFPFNRIDGAQIQKGAIGTHACCVFSEAVAFVGGGRNESLGVYVGANATATKISTQDIDAILAGYTEAQLATVELESRTDRNHVLLHVHLPDRTLVYDAAASDAMQQQVWHVLTTSLDGFSQYRARHFVRAYDQWLVGDPQSSAVGYLTDSVSSHWGQMVRWEFGTIIVYNESKGGIFHALELVALTGRVAVGADPIITTSYSVDGNAWAQDKPMRAGGAGNTTKRLVWFKQGFMRNWRVQRFRGTSDARLTFARLEATLEGLAY